LMETKIEYVVPDPKPLAVASLNWHDDFFGRRFDLRDRNGGFIHTACLAAGLDRCAACASAPAKEEVSCNA
jgi:hypothetical protein